MILDAKRGDIGSTAQHYASEAFDRYGADAVTVNPYLGRDRVQPFLDRADKGVIVLCRTSNPGGPIPGARLRGRRCTCTWRQRSRATGTATATVTGHRCDMATDEGPVRTMVGDMPLLVPGVGAQGGDVAAVLQHGRTATATGW